MKIFRVAIFCLGVCIAALLLFVFWNLVWPQKITEQPRQAIPNFKTFVEPRISIEFQYPNTWKTYTPEISIIYFNAIPEGRDGNVTLKVIPWTSKPDIKSYTSEKYRQELMTAGYYRDIEFVKFDKDIAIAGVDGLFSYHTFKGKLTEVIVQWWKDNLLYTIQAQFYEPILSAEEQDQFTKLLNSIRFVSN